MHIRSSECSRVFGLITPLLATGPWKLGELQNSPKPPKFTHAIILAFLQGGSMEYQFSKTVLRAYPM